MKLLAEKGGDLRAAIAADSALRPAEVLANFVADDKPTTTRSFKGILYETYDSPASGRKRCAGWASPIPSLGPALLWLARRPEPEASPRLLGAQATAPT
jgi:hypothetical protein